MSVDLAGRRRMLVVDGDQHERDGAARAVTDARHAVDTRGRPGGCREPARGPRGLSSTSS
jgi:hypothetical protein